MATGPTIVGRNWDDLRSAPRRQARLLEYVRSRLFVDAQLLKDELGVSIATIRRDLAELEDRRLLRRTHGGAVSVTQVTHDYDTTVRERTNLEEKQRIAAVASAMVAEGDAVMIDSGTTSLQVAKLLAGNQSLTFVTNGQDVLGTLVAGGARAIHVVGGEYVSINRSFSGAMAAAIVRSFNVDKACLSVAAVDVERGRICTSHPQIASAQQAMIEVAQMVIVVADHSKLERTALAVIAPLERIDYIVTGSTARPAVAAIPEKLKKKFVFA
jgi:DeoR family transcriptional regulator, repressor of opine catabolism and conjugal transfer